MSVTERHHTPQATLPENNPAVHKQVAALRLLYRATPPEHLQARIAASMDRADAPASTGDAIDFRYLKPGKQGRGIGGNRIRLRWALGGLALAIVALIAGTLPLAPATTVGGHVPATPWQQAWSMVGHDPQQTGRSPSNGPLAPRLIWSYPGIYGPVIVGPDDSVYGWQNGGLVALSATGQPRWTTDISEGFGGPPTIGTDGVLRMSAEIGGPSGIGNREPHVAFLAVSQQGKRLWTITSLPWATVPQSVPFSKGTAPIVTADNLLYVPLVGPAYGHLQNNGVEIVGARGKPLRRLLAGYGGPIAVASNGTVYQIGYDYASQNFLQASRPDGTLLWSRALPSAQSGTVVVAGNGDIYVSDGSGWGSNDAGDVAVYTPAGKLLWHRATIGVATLAERGDGSILIADRHGLTAVDRRGAPLWHASLGHIADKDQAGFSLAVDTNGHVFVGSVDGTVRAFSARGKPIWTLSAGKPGLYGRGSTVALGPNGVLVVVGTDNLLRFYR
jgi:PQQ-like domain